jgi:hypothetical protein
MLRTYTELLQLDTLQERFDYLKIAGVVGEPTFDDMRYVNQAFYHSREWRQMRSHVIARDLGMDLGAFDTPIQGAPIIHHMNPLTPEDILEGTENLLSPEFLICTSLRTHNAIHYGDKGQLPRPFVERRPGDTLGWTKFRGLDE